MNLWHDKKYDLLVYDLTEPQAVTDYVHEAITLHNGYVCVPNKLFNLQLLTYLGFPVIPPMTDETYDWPICKPWRPREHQRIMANFMVLNPRCFNLSDMGTQKTLSALWAMDYLMGLYPAGQCRALVCSPLSTLQRVWGDAIFRHFPGRRTYVVIHGEHSKRRKLLAQPHDFYLINHDGIRVGAKQVPRLNRAGQPTGRNELKLSGLAEDIRTRADIRIVNIDEASGFRDSTSDRSKVAAVNLKPKDYFCLMTGTPTPNGPLDAFGLAKLVSNAGGETFTSYRARVMWQQSQFKWLPRKGSHIEARKLLMPGIRFDIKDVWDGPPSSTEVRDADLSEQQQDAYKRMKRDLGVIMESGHKITATNEAALRLKLIQIACGAVYDNNHEPQYLLPKPRLTVLREVVEEAGRKVIVFAPFTSVISMLYAEFKGSYSCAIVNGSVKAKERDEILRAFQQDTDPHILFADPASIAHGVDLFAANVCAWFAPTDRTELYLQGKRRIDRPGQEYPTTVVQIASTAPEREIYRRLETNESLQGVMLDMIKRDDRGFL